VKVDSVIKSVGLGLFAISFLLVAATGSSPGPIGVSRVPGWVCAWASIAIPFAGLKDAAFEWIHLLMLMSGLVNLIVLGECVRWLRRRTPEAPLWTSGAVAVGILASWIVLGVDRMTPALGHFLWVAGLVLLFRPIFKRKVTA
jgi:hypothetical protein